MHVDERMIMRTAGLGILGMCFLAIPGQLTGLTGIGLISWAALNVYEVI